MSALRTLTQQISRLSGPKPGTPVQSPRPVEVLPRPDLATELMVFRPLSIGDRAAYLEAFTRSQEALAPWIPLAEQGQSDDAYFEGMVRKGVEGDEKRTAWRRAAFLNDGQFLGMFNLIKIDRGLSWTAEANWWVDSMYAGLGLGSHACRAMVDHALADIPVGLGLHTLRGNISAENEPSMRLARRLGFTCSGERDQLEINGKIVEHEVLTVDSILR